MSEYFTAIGMKGGGCHSVPDLQCVHQVCGCPDPALEQKLMRVAHSLPL
jgi:hypothetical protein